MCIPRINGYRSIGREYANPFVQCERGTAYQLDEVRSRDPVMEFKVGGIMNVLRELKTSMCLLKEGNKSESDQSAGDPTNLTVDIATVEIQPGKAFMHCEAVPYLAVRLPKHRTTDVDPHQKLLKTSTYCGVSAKWIIMSGNCDSDKRRHHQRPPQCIVAKVYMQILEHRMETTGIRRPVRT